MSREEILGVARQVIESDGLQELTFARVAEEMNARAASLYPYFGSKDELLAAIFDDVTTEMYIRLPRFGEGTWDVEIVEHFMSLRRLLQDTPVYREVFAYRAQTLFQGSRMTPFLLRRMEDNLALFVRAGLTPDEAVKVMNAFASFTRAFVLIEHAMQEEDDEQMLQLCAGVLQTVAADLPLVASLDHLAVIGGPAADLYQYGLGLLVAGLRREHPVLASTGTSSSTTSPGGALR